jgi:hypothetical protein
MIPEITIKISFAETPGAGVATAVLGASGGVEIAPPTLGDDAEADMVLAPPEVGDETAMMAGIDIPPPLAAAGVEGEGLPPPEAEEESGNSSEEAKPPPSPGRGAKRGR